MVLHGQNSGFLLIKLWDETLDDVTWLNELLNDETWLDELLENETWFDETILWKT